MKINKLLITAAFAITCFSACKVTLTEAQQDAMNVNSYVDSIAGLAPVYTSANWEVLRMGYKARVAKSNATTSELDASDKAKVKESKVQYIAIKKNYEINIKEPEPTVAVTSITSTY